MLYWILWILVAPFIWLIMPIRIIGKRYLRQVKKQATIFSCNHQTMNDPIILKSRYPRLKCMAKSGLFKTKFSNWFMRSLGAYPVDRGGNDIEAVKTTLKHLKNNKQVLIFPEGTRVKEGESAEYKNGLVMFALKTDCNVLPMIFRKRTKPFRFNTLLIGKPFKFSDLAKFKGVKITKEILSNASNILQEKMNFLKEVTIKNYKKLIKQESKKSSV